jgi:hypothetical protein
MANEYVTLAEAKAFIGRQSADMDAVLTTLTTVGSRWVDTKAGRRFYADSTATARVFRPTTCAMVPIDDAHTITIVETDDGDDGTYATTWTTADYQTLPLNGVGSNGLTGWPTTKLQAVESLDFPMYHARASVRVTAKWGWTAVPADVKQACLYYVHRLFFLRSTPGGFAESTEFAQPIRSLRDIESMLSPYMTTQAGDGRFLVG